MYLANVLLFSRRNLNFWGIPRKSFLFWCFNLLLFRKCITPLSIISHNNYYSKQQTSKAHSAKFEKAKITTLQLDVTTHVTNEPYGTGFLHVVILMILWVCKFFHLRKIPAKTYTLLLKSPGEGKIFQKIIIRSNISPWLTYFYSSLID